MTIEAAKWYRLAAEQDHAGAQFNLGVMYHEGQGVQADSNTGVHVGNLVCRTRI